MAKKKPTPVKTAPQGNLRLEYRSPSELTENPRNWRRHPDSQINALTDVISEVGWAGACLLNERTGRLIDGHARRAVAIKQGAELVPVLVGDWSEEDEAKILATLDPLAAMATADAAALEALMGDVSTQSEAVNNMLDELAKESASTTLPTPGAGGDEFDATPQESGPTRTQTGDLWLIGGKHRLLVGDNTIAENASKLMGGKTVGLCFTSPPYAQQRDYGDAAKEKVQDWHALMCGTFANLPMSDDGQVLVNLGLVHRDGEWVPYWDGWVEWMRQQGWRRFGWYVWDQGPGLPGDWMGRLAPAHEWVFHFNKESNRPKKTVVCKHAGDANHGSGLRSSDGEVSKYSHAGRSVQERKIPDSVIRIMRNKARGVECEHPAVFSVTLAEFIISSWPADVYDPFLGSGTTLIASNRLGRICYGCEIEPRYGDVILKRAEAEGLTVEKISG